MVISRLAPIPPNAVPVSRAASASATVPKSSSPTTANRSAEPSSGDAVEASGAMAAISRLVATRTGGAAVNNQPAAARADRFLAGKRLLRSRQGWAIPAPARPSRRARTWRISPISNGARTTTSTGCAATATTQPFTGLPRPPARSAV